LPKTGGGHLLPRSGPQGTSHQGRRSAFSVGVVRFVAAARWGLFPSVPLVHIDPATARALNVVTELEESDVEIPPAPRTFNGHGILSPRKTNRDRSRGLSPSP
jgi:hypothetical protein